MSHTTAIKGVKIMNIEALQAAIRELNDKGVTCSLLQNAAPRAYFQNQEGLGVADYVIQLANARYDVGLYRQEDGSYEPRTDFWGRSVEEQLGATASAPDKTEQARLGQLFQLYAVNAASMKAREMGQSFQRIENPTTGQIKLVINVAD